MSDANGQAEEIARVVSRVPNHIYRSWTNFNAPQALTKHAKWGFPCTGRHINVCHIVRHLHDFLSQNEQILNAAQDEIGASEDELRRQRALKADLLQVQLDREVQKLLPRLEVAEIHQAWAARLRRAADSLGKRFGPQAQRILADALDDCDKILAEKNL